MQALREFRFLLPLWRAERSSYLWGAFLVSLTCAFWVAVPKLVGTAVGCLDTGIRVDLVPSLALAIVGVVLLRGLTAFWMRNAMIGASRRMEYALRNRLFRHLEDLDSTYFVKVHTGDLINRFTSDVEAVRAVFGPGVMYSLNTFFTLVLALTLMFQISVPLTLYSLIPLVMLTLFMRVLGPRLHLESRRAQERLSDVSIHAQENFSNARVIKAFVREATEIDRMDSLATRYFDQNMRLARLRGWMNAVLFLMGDLVVLLLVALGGWELMQGQIALGEFAEFKGVQLLLIWPMLALGWVINIFQRGAASAKRLNEILEARPLVDDSEAEADRQISTGGISCRDVSFGHLPEQTTLRDIAFDLPPGQTLGIVGPTASGKTTLLRLIPRLYPARSGTIEIDGHPLPNIPLGHLRDAIGYVPQEPFLFSATIEENIAFGCDDVTFEAVREVAELVRIHEEIVDFPDGYKQRVGERGITLSGGQKQRLALARALLKRPRILLLDDVLSAVDAQTEREILAGLRGWTRDLTTVIVSHRLSAVRHARLILVLEQGVVKQRGTHEELMRVPGFYGEQYRKQTLEDELESL